MRSLAAIGALALVTIPAAAFADVPGRDWIDRDRVVRMLAKKGYRVTKMEADDGHWEGEARRGRANYEFHVDPHSGAITKLERDRD